VQTRPSGGHGVSRTHDCRTEFLWCEAHLAHMLAKVSILLKLAEWVDACGLTCTTLDLALTTTLKYTAQISSCACSTILSLPPRLGKSLERSVHCRLSAGCKNDIEQLSHAFVLSSDAALTHFLLPFHPASSPERQHTGYRQSRRFSALTLQASSVKHTYPS